MLSVAPPVGIGPRGLVVVVVADGLVEVLGELVGDAVAAVEVCAASVPETAQAGFDGGA